MKLCTVPFATQTCIIQSFQQWLALDRMMIMTQIFVANVVKGFGNLRKNVLRKFLKITKVLQTLIFIIKTIIFYSAKTNFDRLVSIVISYGFCNVECESGQNNSDRTILLN